MDYTQKINRLDEFEIFFNEPLELKVINKIQYISLRKNSYNRWEILVGVSDMIVNEDILKYAPRILKSICNHQLKNDNEFEKRKQQRN